jgi:hypothetical protein
LATGFAGSAGRTIVGVSMISVRAVAPYVPRWRSMAALAVSDHSRLLEIETSAAMNVFASVVKTSRALWITDRSATMAATPTAMQMKKNSRRRHDARVSRTAMRSTNIIAPSPLG